MKRNPERAAPRQAPREALHEAQREEGPLGRLLALEQRLQARVDRAHSEGESRIAAARAEAERLLRDDSPGRRLEALRLRLEDERRAALEEIERWRERQLALYQKPPPELLDELAVEVVRRVLSGDTSTEGPSR